MVELLAFRLDVGIYVAFHGVSVLLLEDPDVGFAFCTPRQTYLALLP